MKVALFPEWAGAGDVGDNEFWNQRPWGIVVSAQELTQWGVGVTCTRPSQWSMLGLGLQERSGALGSGTGPTRGNWEQAVTWSLEGGKSALPQEGTGGGVWCVQGAVRRWVSVKTLGGQGVELEVDGEP